MHAVHGMPRYHNTPSVQPMWEISVSSQRTSAEMLCTADSALRELVPLSTIEQDHDVAVQLCD